MISLGIAVAFPVCLSTATITMYPLASKTADSLLKILKPYLMDFSFYLSYMHLHFEQVVEPCRFLELTERLNSWKQNVMLFHDIVEVEAEIPVQLLLCSFEKSEVVREMNNLCRVGFGP